MSASVNTKCMEGSSYGFSSTYPAAVYVDVDDAAVQVAGGRRGEARKLTTRAISDGSPMGAIGTLACCRRIGQIVDMVVALESMMGPAVRAHHSVALVPQLVTDGTTYSLQASGH
jgi:hypothetical protein